MRRGRATIWFAAGAAAILAAGVVGAATHAGAPVVGKPCARSGTVGTTSAKVAVVCKRDTKGKLVWARRATTKPVVSAPAVSAQAAASGPPAAGNACSPEGSKATTPDSAPITCARDSKGQLTWTRVGGASQGSPAAGATGQTGGSTQPGPPQALEPLPGQGGLSLAPGVKLIDAGTTTIRLSVGVSQGVDVDPATGKVFIGASSAISEWCGIHFGATRGDRLAVVDPAAGIEVASVGAGGSPIWPRVDPTNGIVWLAESSGTLGYHSLTDGHRLGAVAVGGLPHDVAADPGAGLIVVSNTTDGSQKKIAVVRASDKAIVSTHTVEAFPHRIVLDPAKHRAWIVGVESGALSVIDTASGARGLPTRLLRGGSSSLRARRRATHTASG